MNEINSHKEEDRTLWVGWSRGEIPVICQNVLWLGYGPIRYVSIKSGVVVTIHSSRIRLCRFALTASSIIVRRHYVLSPPFL